MDKLKVKVIETTASEIKTKEEAENWVRLLAKAELLFHFDDCAIDCLGHLISVKDAEKIQLLVNHVYEILEDPFKIICEINELNDESY